MSALAIVSGGMDSVTMLYNYKDKISEVLTFNYGSKHNQREVWCAEYHADFLNKNWTLIDLDFIGKYFESNLLQSGGEVPEGHYEDPIMKKTVVPFRNAIMLSIAVGLAESKKLKSVYYGAHAGDHAIYPDCREEFFKPFRQAASRGTYNNVELVAPFITLTKKQIGDIGYDLIVDFTKTYSCYKGGEIHCGKCGTCVERQEALGSFDPTEYLTSENVPQD